MNYTIKHKVVAAVTIAALLSTHLFAGGIGGGSSGGSPTVPGGSNGQIQYNNAGSFDGTATGTGVLTALGVNVGSAGAFVTFNGAGGNPSSIGLAGGTGLPIDAGTINDLPFSRIAQASVASILLGRGSAAGAGDFQEITLGTNLSMSGTTLNATGGLASQSNNTILANISGGAAVPSANTLTAILDAILGTTTGSVPYRDASSWTTAIMATLPASTAQGDLLYLSAADTLARLPKDTNATRVLCNTGTTNNPAWCQVPVSNGLAGAGTGVLTALAANTNATDGIVTPNGTATLSNKTIGTSTFTGTQTFAAGSAAAPTINFTGDTTSGFFSAGAGLLSVSVSGIQIGQFIGGGAFRFFKGSADTAAPEFGGRKSRGTVAAPAAITTGDDLLDLVGNGYVGAGSGYQRAATITISSTGTISDSATGIGGIIDFKVAKTGAENTQVFRINGTSQHTSHMGVAPAVGACGTSPSLVGRDQAMLVTVGTGGTATDCAVTFNNAFTNAPICTSNSDTDIVGLKVVTTTTTVTVSATAAFTASSKLHIICAGFE